VSASGGEAHEGAIVDPRLWHVTALSITDFLSLPKLCIQEKGVPQKWSKVLDWVSMCNIQRC